MLGVASRISQARPLTREIVATAAVHLIRFSVLENPAGRVVCYIGEEHGMLVHKTGNMVQDDCLLIPSHIY
jgi:hypothetical protein